MRKSLISNPQSPIPNLQSSISHSGRRWVLGFALIVMLITTLPYILGYAAQGVGWRFTGFVFGVGDGNTYIGKMLRGAVGDWLFRTPYTAQSQRGVLAFAPYLFLGKLASPPGQHEQLVALFHLFRVGAGILSIMASYDFLALFIVEERWRRWGVVLAALGGSLGWVLIALGRGTWLGSLPLDFYSPETFGFLALYGLPHLALARALLLWGLCIYLKPQLTLALWDLPWRDPTPASPHGNSQRPLTFWPQGLGVFTGLLWLLLGLIQPLTVVVAWGVIGAHVVVLGMSQVWQNWKKGHADWAKWRIWLFRAVWAVVVSSPLVVYTALAFNADPVIREWTAQNLVTSPHPLHYLLAYGLLLPFVVIGAWQQLKAGRQRDWLLVAWSLVFPFLVYAPYPLQRRLADGFWVALVALTLVAYDHSKHKLFRRSFGIVLLAFPTTLFLLIGGLMAASRPAEPLFRPVDEVAAFQFLVDQTDGDDVVLSSYETGNALPAWVPVFVVIGHGPESVGFAELSPRVEAFYQEDTLDGDRLSLLKEFNVDYVFWGPTERKLGDWNLATSTYLTSVYQQGEYEVYAVDMSL